MTRRRKSSIKQQREIAKFIAFGVGIIFFGLIYLIKLVALCVYKFYTDLKAGCAEYKEQQMYNIQHSIEEEEEERIARQIQENYEKAVDRFRTLAGYTENKLYYQVVKTEFPAEGRIREYVNFYTYDRDTVAVENANQLINTVLNNVLCIYTGKSKKLQNTIVLDDYACDFKDLSRNLAEKIGVEEIQMAVA